MSKKDYDLKYQREKLAYINLKVKPEIKEKIDEGARKAGKPTRAFILDAVFKEIERMDGNE